jgi:hypothetical protein
MQQTGSHVGLGTKRTFVRHTISHIDTSCSSHNFSNSSPVVNRIGTSAGGAGGWPSRTTNPPPIE